LTPITKNLRMVITRLSDLFRPQEMIKNVRLMPWQTLKFRQS